jgi:glycosyltransferase involved in cell wall biosynthesis
VKKLMIDARWLDSGLGAYTLNVIRGLDKTQGFETCLLTLPKHAGALKEFGYEVVPAAAPIYSLREQGEVLWAARNCDVLHVPHYNAPLMRRGCMLVTIHDLTHIIDPTQRRRVASWVYAQPVLRLAAKRADHLFTVSEYTKSVIVDHLSVKPDKITVTYSGVGPHIYQEDRGASKAKIAVDFGCSDPFVLFVGNLKPNKNVSGLLRAFDQLIRRHRLPHRLLIIGDEGYWRAVLQRTANELKMESKVVFAGRVSDEQVRAAYSAAELTVLPSFEEGFGLPVVESMACGTPVACSAVASLPEVGGNAAEYFSPGDLESIVSAMEHVLLDQDHWNHLQRVGFEQAARFTWDGCAKRHFPTYREYLTT